MLDGAPQWLDWVGELGIAAWSLLALWALWKRVVVFGWALDDERAAHEATRLEKDEWKAMALSLMGVGERSVELVERSVASGRRRDGEG